MMKRWLVVLGTLMSVGLFLSGCSQTNSTSSNGKIKVVASTDFYGEAAKAVLGSHGTVTSIIDKPSMDPHDYEPTTEVAKKVNQADVTIANGIGYDSWMKKLTADSDQGKHISVGEDLMNKHNGDNPHLWYNPATMPKLVDALATKFGKLQPKHKAEFKRNAAKFKKTLAPINSEIKEIKQIPVKNHQVYVSEPVFDYGLSALGFKVANPAFENAVENESDPSPKSITAMQAGLKHHKVAFFVVNKQVDSKTINNLVALAKKNGVPVLKVTETLPAGKTYQSWMLGQYRTLKTILEK